MGVSSLGLGSGLVKESAGFSVPMEGYLNPALIGNMHYHCWRMLGKGV